MHLSFQRLQLGLKLRNLALLGVQVRLGSFHALGVVQTLASFAHKRGLLLFKAILQLADELALLGHPDNKRCETRPYAWHLVLTCLVWARNRSVDSCIT